MHLGNVVVRFKHHQSDSRKHRSFTTCEVRDAENTDLILGTGKVTCSKNDQYCKEVGRKKSMKRALDSSNLSKGDRTSIWENYRTSTLRPRWNVRNSG